MIRLTDPTMAGCTDPARRLRKLQDRRQVLREYIAQTEDQIACIEHEIAQLGGITT